ncbi:MAG: aspartate carbamoyltransferase regulatory subunit [Candidatus Thorarchaeota archaeon]|nr:MAG: aspartate carbamoyltransferase regulatory subunit [Candidatus Thorarchaeota archaeon]
MATTPIDEKLRVDKIKDGTVIDHIRGGHALEVLEILGITGKEGAIVSLAMNVASSKMGRKDIVKIETRFLDSAEVAKIALVAPEATINLIRDTKVVKKTRVQLPNIISDVIKCPNTRCITNQEREPITASYQVVSKSPIQLKCLYCWTLVSDEEIISQFTVRK